MDLAGVPSDWCVFVDVEFPDYRCDVAIPEEVEVDSGCVMGRYVRLLAYLVEGDVGSEGLDEPSYDLAKNELFPAPSCNISKQETDVFLVDRLGNAASRDVIVN